MPKRGIVVLEYYSGECRGLRGCRPNPNFRKSLLNLVRTSDSTSTSTTVVPITPLSYMAAPLAKTDKLILSNRVLAY